MLLNLIKIKKAKQKNKKAHTKLNLVCNNYFAFYKYNTIKEFTKLLFYSKQNDSIEFQFKLELFYHDTIESKPNNEDQKKDLKKKEILCLI